MNNTAATSTPAARKPTMWHSGVTCSLCERELDGEDIAYADDNDGYTSCCNEPTNR
jgi:hypothetical protein